MDRMSEPKQQADQDMTSKEETSAWDGMTMPALKQEQVKLESMIKSARESRLVSIQEQLEQKLAQLKQHMRQQLPEGHRFLSIQSQMRRLSKQREHLESKRQEHQKALAEVEEKL